MPGLEGVIRPFTNDDVTPVPIHQDNGQSVPQVRLIVGLIGGTKTFSYTGSSSLTSYMAAVHTEKPSTAFDMTTGKLAS